MLSLLGFAKLKRFENPQLLQKMRELPCFVCGKGPSDPAHIQTVKSGGPDSADNLIPLCRRHHTEQHQMGIRSFAREYGIPLTDSIYPRLSFEWQF